MRAEEREILTIAHMAPNKHFLIPAGLESSHSLITVCENLFAAGLLDIGQTVKPGWRITEAGQRALAEQGERTTTPD